MKSSVMIGVIALGVLMALQAENVVVVADDRHSQAGAVREIDNSDLIVNVQLDGRVEHRAAVAAPADQQELSFQFLIPLIVHCMNCPPPSLRAGWGYSAINCIKNCILCIFYRLIFMFFGPSDERSLSGRAIFMHIINILCILCPKITRPIAPTLPCRLL